MEANTPIFSAAVILLVLGSPVFAYQQVIDLGAGTAYSINDNGLIVGESGGRAFLYNPSGGGSKIDLEASAAPHKASLIRINNNNKIVGQADGWACLFDSTGGGANILLGGTGFGGSAYSINNSNKIVGVSGGGHACFFSNFRDLGTLNLGSEEHCLFHQRQRQGCRQKLYLIR